MSTDFFKELILPYYINVLKFGLYRVCSDNMSSETDGFRIRVSGSGAKHLPARRLIGRLPARKEARNLLNQLLNILKT